MWLNKQHYNFLIERINQLECQLAACQQANSVLVERMLQMNGAPPITVTKTEQANQAMKDLDALTSGDLWEDDDEVASDKAANREMANEMMELQP